MSWFMAWGTWGNYDFWRLLVRTKASRVTPEYHLQIWKFWTELVAQSSRRKNCWVHIPTVNSAGFLFETWDSQGYSGDLCCSRIPTGPGARVQAHPRHQPQGRVAWRAFQAVRPGECPCLQVKNGSWLILMVQKIMVDHDWWLVYWWSIWVDVEWSRVVKTGYDRLILMLNDGHLYV